MPGHKDERAKIEKRLTNKELLQVRRKAMVNGLGLFEEHARTHTATGVHRKLEASGRYENGLDSPLRAPTSQRPATHGEIQQMVLHTLLLAGEESLPMADACRRVAARFGLQDSQVSSLRLEVHSYLKRVADEVSKTFPGDAR